MSNKIKLALVWLRERLQNDPDADEPIAVLERAIDADRGATLPVVGFDGWFEKRQQVRGKDGLPWPTDCAIKWGKAAWEDREAEVRDLERQLAAVDTAVDEVITRYDALLGQEVEARTAAEARAEQAERRAAENAKKAGWYDDATAALDGHLGYDQEHPQAARRAKTERLRAENQRTRTRWAVALGKVYDGQGDDDLATATVEAMQARRELVRARERLRDTALAEALGGDRGEP